MPSIWDRVAIGSGLMMLALQPIVAAAARLHADPDVRAIFTTISGDPLLDLVIAAAVTCWRIPAWQLVLGWSPRADDRRR